MQTPFNALRKYDLFLVHLGICLKSLNFRHAYKPTANTYVGLCVLKMAIWCGLAGCECYTRTMLSHLKLSIFMFHIVQSRGKGFSV